MYTSKLFPFAKYYMIYYTYMYRYINICQIVIIIIISNLIHLVVQVIFQYLAILTSFSHIKELVCTCIQGLVQICGVQNM